MWHFYFCWNSGFEQGIYFCCHKVQSIPNQLHYWREVLMRVISACVLRSPGHPTSSSAGSLPVFCGPNSLIGISCRSFLIYTGHQQSIYMWLSLTEFDPKCQSPPITSCDLTMTKGTGRSILVTFKVWPLSNNFGDLLEMQTLWHLDFLNQRLWGWAPKPLPGWWMIDKILGPPD